MDRYKLSTLPATEVEFLNTIGRQRGCLGTGNKVDMDKISRIFIAEIRDATLGRISMETPIMASAEKIETKRLMDELDAERKAKKEERRKNAKTRR